VDPREDQKRAAARAAADVIEDGMLVGLGTGTTVGHFLAALAARRLDLRCVATSPATEEMARALGLSVEGFETLERLDVAVDGTDQVTPDFWLVKGGGAALTREKVVAAASSRFLVIASSDKEVDRLDPPVPLELLRFGLGATLRRLGELGPIRRRGGAGPTPDGGVIVDFLGEIVDPVALSLAFDADPGLIDHGLFAPSMVSEVLIGRADGSVERRVRG